MITADDSKVVRDIKRHEGFRHKPYKDSLGIWTIGWGSNMFDLSVEEWVRVCKMKGEPTGGLSKAQCKVFLTHDIARELDFLKRYVWFGGLSDNRQRALLEMVYQLGQGSFRGFRRMLRNLRDRNFHLVPSSMENSLWARQTPVRVAHCVMLWNSQGAR